MLRTIALLQERAAAATGSVGSDKPLESMTDALGSFPATRVLLAMPPEEESYWLEGNMLAKARSADSDPCDPSRRALNRAHGADSRWASGRSAEHSNGCSK